ncbi:hypothetical protein [Lysinibacillus xylanilyticus]|uniref:hypothetical protein n=1 Tax=Lysinibacillus xylanilyticus TaxID=582475 RepID=UPI003CFD0D6C
MIELKPLSKFFDEKDLLDIIQCNSQDFAFVSGSLIQGMGNENSDLDVFVVTRDFDNVHHPTDIVYDENIKTTFDLINGITCDIEYWPLKVIEDLINQINDIDFDDTSIRTFNQIKIEGYSSGQLTSFLHRFIMGIPIANINLFNELKTKLNINNYLKLKTRIYVNIVDNDYYDIIGNTNKGDIETALILAREVIIKTIGAYVCFKGQSIDRDKWAYYNLRELAKENAEDKDLLKEVDKVLFFTNLNEESQLIDNVEDILFLINKIINKIGNENGGI